jgi:hypothetical protein
MVVELLKKCYRRLLEKYQSAVDDATLFRPFRYVKLIYILISEASLSIVKIDSLEELNELLPNQEIEYLKDKCTTASNGIEIKQ